MTDKIEPLNMHGHANTWEEELDEVCRERDALRDDWVASQAHLNEALNERDALRAENERLRTQNDELHRQIDYTRSLAWDDISDDQIVINLRHMLDRPKGLERPNC